MRCLIFAFCIMASISYAEEETLLNGVTDSGYFAGPVWKMTRYNGDMDVLLGGHAGWIINHTYSVGIGGYGMMSGFRMPMHGHGSFDDHDHGNKLSYGGVEFEYIWNSDKLMHYSFSALLGAGSLGIDDHQGIEEEYLDHEHYTDTVFVFEPSVNGIVNINPWFRLGVGVSYRLVNGSDTIGIDSSDAGGAAMTLTLKFGTF